MGPWAIPALMSIFGGILGYQGGREAEVLGRQQTLMAEENAMLGKRELQEQVRRQELEDRRLRGAALARGAGSGALVSGSIATYLSYMEDEQGRQLSWLKTSGASKIRLQLQSDKLRASATISDAKTQQWSSLLQGATGAFGYADQGGAFMKGPTYFRTGYGR